MITKLHGDAYVPLRRQPWELKSSAWTRHLDGAVSILNTSFLTSIMNLDSDKIERWALYTYIGSEGQARPPNMVRPRSSPSLIEWRKHRRRTEFNLDCKRVAGDPFVELNLERSRDFGAVLHNAPILLS